MWIIAGKSSSIKADVWSSVDGSTWTEVKENAAFGQRQYHGSVAFDGMMWVVAGHTGSSNLDDVWYSDDGSTWILAATGKFTARQKFALTVYNNKI